MKLLLSNDSIKDSVVILIDPNGKNVGKTNIKEAKNIAFEESLDLVMVGRSNDGIAVCKIIDYGKMKYEESKKKLNKKHLKMKEISCRITTSDHDMNIKKRKIREFLVKGHDVKFSLELRGRQTNFVNNAIERMKKDISEFSEISKSDGIVSGNRSMFVILKAL